MTDADMIEAVRSVVAAGLAAKGWAFDVIQRGQPTQQGVPSSASVFFQKMYETDYGFPATETVRDGDDPTKNIEITKQCKEVEIQFSALVINNPSMDARSQPTAMDVVSYVALWLKTRTVMRLMAAQNMGYLRFTKIRNDYFEDDRHRHESWPTFELVLTYQNTTSNAVDIAQDGTLEVHRVPD